MNPNSPTLDLRDIHLPDGISWWPLAPGWWIMLSIILLSLAVGIFLYRRKQRRRMHRAATHEFANIKVAYAQHGDVQQLVKALSVWLRRVCLSFYPRVDVAGLTGQAWLEFLDNNLSTMQFSEGAGQVLISAPYQQVAKLNADELLTVCQAWLSNLPRHAQQTRGRA